MRFAKRSNTGVEALDLAVGALADVCHLALRAVLDLALDVGLGTLGLELGDVLLELLGASVDLDVALVRDALLLDLELVAQLRKVLVTAVNVHLGDHVRGEVDDLFEVLRREVEEVAEARRNALEVPDVGDGSSKLDVTHALTAHLGTGHLDAAALADDAAVADALVLAAAALPVAGGAEDLLAEEPVLFRLQGAVIDRLRLLHFTVRPLADFLRGGKADAQFAEFVHVMHSCEFLFLRSSQISSTLEASGRLDSEMPSDSAAW